MNTPDTEGLPCPAPESGRLLKHSLLLMAATQFGSVANLLFQVLTMHRLPKEEYGVLATMLSLAVMIGTPMEALRTAVAHHFARLAGTGRAGQGLALFCHWGRWVLLASGTVWLGGALASGALARLYHLPSAGPVLMMVLILGGSLATPLFLGAMQGFQAFGWFALTSQSWGVVRLVWVAVLLGAVGTQVTVLLWAQVAAVAATLLLGGLGLRRLLPRGAAEGPAETPSLTYLARSLAMMAAFAFLMNADLSFVKHYFDPVAAGGFAVAATIARAIVFLPMPVALAMFPKVVSRGESSRASWRTLGFALGLVLAIILGAVAACWLLAPWLLRLFTGAEADAIQIGLLRGMLLALSPLGLTWLLMNFELAQHRFGALPGLAVCAAGYGLTALLRHGSPWQIMEALGGWGLLSAAVVLCGLPWKQGLGRP